MKITQEKLNQIIASHGKWLRDEEGGERANLRGANLRGANLEDADLRGANLEDADLRGANLGGANLEDADLRGANLGGADLGCANLGCANLRGANLRGANLEDANLGGANLGCANLGGANLGCADLGCADLRGANLEDADLRGANLDKTYYQVVRIGSRNAATTYCVEDDNVLCGCWNNYKGGTLEEFRKRVESVYGENGKTPNKKYYGQYIAAIEFFEKMAKLAKKEEEK